MPSYDELDNEAAWREEIEPPALLALKAGVRRRHPGAGVGIKGDNHHTSGYHRSRRWIKFSAHCTNRNYSVSRIQGDRSGGNENWCCAMDVWGLPQAELLAMCGRLDAAVRAGRLEKITEWYGNVDGDGRVDGYDNISNRVASSDSSHLTHLHMSFDRGRADEDHSDVLAVLIGDDDMGFDDPIGRDYAPSLDYGKHLPKTGIAYTWAGVDRANAALARLEAAVVELAKRVDLDPAELQQVMAAAAAGAEAGVAKGADELAAALAPLLNIDEQAVKNALAEVLGTVRIVVPGE